MPQGYQLRASTILSFKEGRVERSIRATEMEQLEALPVRRCDSGWEDPSGVV